MTKRILNFLYVVRFLSLPELTTQVLPNTDIAVVGCDFPLNITGEIEKESTPSANKKNCID